jgi:phosphoribosyl-ATP pyrophosphohydrolase
MNGSQTLASRFLLGQRTESYEAQKLSPLWISNSSPKRCTVLSARKVGTRTTASVHKRHATWQSRWQEAAELLELFQWHEDVKDKEELASELADVALYLLQLASVSEIDLEKAILDKLEINKTRDWDHGTES